MSKQSVDTILHIVLPVPVRHHFDYLAVAGHTVQPGMRVQVPFGKSKQAVGIVVDVSATSVLENHRLNHQKFRFENRQDNHLDNRLDSHHPNHLVNL